MIGSQPLSSRRRQMDERHAVHCLVAHLSSHRLVAAPSVAGVACEGHGPANDARGAVMTYLLVLVIGMVLGALCAVAGFAWCVAPVYRHGGEEDEGQAEHDLGAGCTTCSRGCL